jgi:hypothetical protein
MSSTTQDDHLRMGSGVTAMLYSIARRRDHDAVAHRNRTDRHLTATPGRVRDAKRATHAALVGVDLQP